MLNLDESINYELMRQKLGVLSLFSRTVSCFQGLTSLELELESVR